MSGWPVILNVADKRIVVIGGGPVALRRIRSLLEAGASADRITVIAPDICDELKSLPLNFRERAYHVGDCIGAFAVVIATDDAEVNEQATREATAAGALVNRADQPDAGSVSVMAHRRIGPVTLAAATDGASAAAASRIVTGMVATLDAQWVSLLEIAAEFRAIAQQRITDKALRQAILKRLTDDEAMKILKAQGPDALRRHLAQLMDSTHAQ